VSHECFAWHPEGEEDPYSEGSAHAIVRRPMSIAGGYERVLLAAQTHRGQSVLFFTKNLANR